MPKESDSKSLQEMARQLMRDLEVLARQFLAGQRTWELSRSETALLRFLTDHGPSTMSDISNDLGLALSSTTGVVDAMVR